MTFFVAAVENVCRQVARAGGVWADALLTSWSPLTYERGDYQDLTEEMDPDWEPLDWSESAKEGYPQNHRHTPDPVLSGRHVCTLCGAFSNPLDPSPTIIQSAPPPSVDGDGSSEEIAAFPRRPSEGHPTSISLPMFKFSDLVEIAAPYIGLHDGFYSQDRKHYACRCGQWFNSFEDHADHVAELVVSALTAELTGLAYDQSHPQTEQ